jgi:hypothetical protein
MVIFHIDEMELAGIEQLPRPLRAAFAAACAERLLPAYHKFSACSRKSSCWHKASSKHERPSLAGFSRLGKNFQNQNANKTFRLQVNYSCPSSPPGPEVQGHLINCKKAVSFL